MIAHAREGKPARPSGMAEWAACYAGLGFAVFPVRGDKSPATPGGFKDAVGDPDAARRAWAGRRGCGIGVANGAASGGLVALDLDVHGDRDGRAALERWLAERGHEMPATAEAATPSGGAHLYFRAPGEAPGRRIGVLPGVDFLGEGGYSVLPPTQTEKGRYEWKEGHAPWEAGVAGLPGWMGELLGRGTKEPRGQSRCGAFSLPETIGEGERNATLYGYACSLRARGRDEVGVHELVGQANAERCRPPLPADEVARIAASACTKPRGTGGDAPTVSELADELRADAAFDGLAHDSLARCLWVDSPMPWGGGAARPWDDEADGVQAFAHVQSRHRRARREDVRDALALVGMGREFNPVVRMLESLPPWDGVPRMGSLFTAFLGCPDDSATREVCALLLRAAVARAYSPGVKFDYMPVLVGAQGCGKSSFVAALAMEPRFYTDGLRDFRDPKRAGEAVAGRWLVEVPELSGMTRASVDAVKAFVTSQGDTYRPAYGKGHRATTYPRSCVLVGTTNPRAFLFDPTGDRRFLPVRCGEVAPRLQPFGGEGRTYIEQAWAEALRAYRAGPARPLVLSEAAALAVAGSREGYRDEPVWMGDLLAFLGGVAEDGGGGRERRVNMKMLLVEAVGLSAQDANLRGEVAAEVRTAMENMPGWRRMPGKQRARWRGTEYAPAQCWEYWPFPKGSAVPAGEAGALASA